MSGFAGFLSTRSREGDDESIARMNNALAHRGPHGAGVWSDRSAGIALGQRRLALDGGPDEPAFPVTSRSRRYVIAFSGAIFNHRSLRREIDARCGGLAWGGSDTAEVIAAGFDLWGLHGTIERLLGTFAFAVWDRLTRSLLLARDRVGERPLYYGWQGASFLFGSELKALREHPDFVGAIDRGALCLLLRHNVIATPSTIYDGIFKLPAGCTLHLSGDARRSQLVEYWSGARVALSGSTQPIAEHPEQAVSTLEALLVDAIGLQTETAKPPGALLSGGLDSSTIVALMQARSTRPIKTFTIGVEDEALDEARHARAVARHLATDHTELYVTGAQALEVLPQMPRLYDEPFADASQIPMFLAARLASATVNVMLTGDGGDELFCGYNRYLRAERMRSGIARLPVSWRLGLASAMRGLAPERLNRLFDPIMQVAPGRLRNVDIGHKIEKLSDLVTAQSTLGLYRSLSSAWRDPESVVLDAVEPVTHLDRVEQHLNALGAIERMMAQDLIGLLPDDILVKVDRAAMGVSLEPRAPLLDHRIVEFAWRLPQSLKVRNGKTKWVLRELLHRYVPKALVDRPKMGFGVPIGKWLRGPLREWAEALLDETRLRTEGFLDAAVVRRKWSEHLGGRRNWEVQLWNVLMFQAWLEDRGTR